MTEQMHAIFSFQANNYFGSDSFSFDVYIQSLILVEQSLSNNKAKLKLYLHYKYFCNFVIKRLLILNFVKNPSL
jgi:hypothetical protein